MEKLRVTSRRLQIVVLILIILTPCAVALDAGMGAWAQLLNLPQGFLLDTARFSGVNLLAAICLGSIKPAVYMIAFWFLYKLLGFYREGIIFTADNVAAIRKIGWAVASIDIADMVQTLVTGPVLTLLQISSAYISVQLEFGFLIVGLFIVLIAYVMDMGRELKEQDSLVI